MLEKSAYEMGSILHVPPHGPCGAFGAGQPWASNARFRDPLDKRGLASGFLRKVWFWGPVHAAPVCCLFGLFVWYMCGAGSVGGALYSDVLSEYKAPGCERWGEESVVLRGLPAASVLLCVARLKRTNEGSRHSRTFAFSEGSRRLSNSVGPFAACRRFQCRPRLWSCVMFHGVRGTLLLF